MKTARLLLNGKPIADACPKCKNYETLYVSQHLKWGPINSWQNFVRCVACTYESKVK